MGHCIETTLDLQHFYPDELNVAQIIQTKDEIQLKIFTHSQSCKCPRCRKESAHRHGTYTRKLQDLPILGKTTKLLVNAHEYQCDNTECPTVTFVENSDGFLNYYSRMTDRCMDFICTLALETSCEGAARVCKEMGIKISGDSIIRILMKRFGELSIEPTEDCIGIDDFATKKGNKYCTIVCNGNSHTPIAVLEGRDGASLKEWLQNNKHVKCVTRDRASVYAKILNEEIPDAMQIADRFHLHQNLLEAVKKALSSGAVPQTIRISENQKQNMPSGASEDDGKKNGIHRG